MIKLKKALAKNPVVYVTRDLERAYNLNEKGFFIITNSSAFAQSSAKKNKNIRIIASEKTLDTHELLNHPETKGFLFSLKNFSILVFKNTPLIENTCEKENWRLLNPPAAISSKIEEKITQIEWLGELGKFLPSHKVEIGTNLEWNNNNYVIQFNRAHTGTGTLLVTTPNQVEELRIKFPLRPMRITEYISGPSFTNNNVVWGKDVLVGPVNYQITGLKPFTDNQFSTVGNDWGVVKKILNKKQLKEIKIIAESVGKKLANNGWRGLFGLDYILDQKTGKILLIEINARQPASTSFESLLQKAAGKKIKTFEAHLAALLDMKNEKFQISEVKDGAQIIKRVPHINSVGISEKSLGALQKTVLKVIEYENKEAGQDLLRIQSKKGIMFAHNTFNKLGENIQKIMS